MGGVYRAYDRELDRDVALKVILPHLSDDPVVLERFKREIQLSSRITHKNVLRIFDLGDALGMKYVTMQFVEGEDFSHLLKREAPLGPDRLIRLFREMCRGVEAAHEQGVVHRDLKPQNVMIDARDGVYVTDFGLAKSVTQAGMTEAGAVMGTPHFMAPEQVKGLPVDRRSDIYSLGLILYQMATGVVPFGEGSAYEIMMRRLHQPLRPAAELNPAVPQVVSRVIERCTALEPAARYQGVGEILVALDASAATVKLAHHPQPRGPGKPWGRWASVVAAVIVAFGAGGWWLLRGRQPPTVFSERAAQTLLIADFENRTGEPVFDGTLEPAFGLALEGASFVTSFNRVQARKIAAQLQPGAGGLTESLARLVAVREGIGVVASGTIEKRGNEYRIAAKAVDAVTGRDIENAEVDASGKDTVLSAATRLAARVRRALGDQTSESAQLAAAETFTASSVEAAHEYAVGQEMQSAGKWDEAIGAYTRAVALDPALGRAYAGLATVYANLGRPRDSEAQFDKALSHIGRMSEREKLRTRGSYFLVRREPAKAIEQFEELVKRFPADTAGMANLALAHFYERDMARALADGRRAAAIYPKNVPQRNNVGLYAMYAGDFEAAISEQQAVLEMNPRFALAFVGLAISELALGRTEAAVATYGRLAQLDARGASMATAGLADAALYEGRVKDALALLDKGVEADLANKDLEAAAQKLIMAAEAQLLAGRKAQASSATERAMAMSQSVGVQFGAGRILLAVGQETNALAMAGRLSERLESDPQAYGLLLLAEAQARRGNKTDAVKLIGDARKKADTWLGRFDRARAYLALGAFAEAHSELEVCLKRRGEATALFLDESPTYHLLPPVYYYLGRAEEGLNDPGAAESYRTYLSIKTKADNDPLVADARRGARGAPTAESSP